MKKWKELPNKIGMRKQMWVETSPQCFWCEPPIIAHVSYAYEHA